MKRTYFLEFTTNKIYSVLIDATTITQAIDYAEDLFRIKGQDVFFSEEESIQFNFGKSVDPDDYDLPRYETPKEYEVYND